MFILRKDDTIKVTLEKQWGKTCSFKIIKLLSLICIKYLYLAKAELNTKNSTIRPPRVLLVEFFVTRFMWKKCDPTGAEKLHTRVHTAICRNFLKNAPFENLTYEILKFRNMRFLDFDNSEIWDFEIFCFVKKSDPSSAKNHVLEYLQLCVANFKKCTFWDFEFSKYEI